MKTVIFIILFLMSFNKNYDLGIEFLYIVSTLIISSHALVLNKLDDKKTRLFLIILIILSLHLIIYFHEMYF